MNALRLVPLLVLLLPAIASAQPLTEDPDDPVLAAMVAELARAEAELGGLDEPPYYVALQVIEVRRATIHGEEGGLQGYRPGRGRTIQADVRVGSPELDSTHPLREATWDEPPPPGRELGLAEDPEVLRREIWREIDARYRVAQDRWQRVLADRQVLVEEEASWDLAPASPEVELHPVATLDGVDLAVWEDAARRASAVFAGSSITHDPTVSISGEAETRWFVSTEGHRLREGATRFRASVRADSLADDGTVLSLFEAWDSARPDGLPDGDELVETVTALEVELRELRDAPEEEPYQGPAILSGRAAAVFFHEIFGHRVEGHRLKRVDDAQTFRNRVGEAILPPFLSVYDDPTLPALGDQDLRGFYRFDDEGVRAERVTLVRDGVLEGFLESRSPVGEAGRSNAHGRRQAGHDVVTRQGNLLIEASESVDAGTLRARLIEEVRAAGLEHGLYIEDIEGGFTFTDRDLPNAFQIDVVSARRVYADGRPDEVVRGLDLIGTPLQTFAQIVAAGPEQEVFNGTCGAESGWVPVSAAAPALLVRQLETQRKLKAQSKPPLTSPPVATDLPEAATGSDLLLDALVAGADRAAAELRLEDADGPAWVTVIADDRDTARVAAEFGELRRETGLHKRPARVEVVVGTLELNSSRIEGGAVATLPEAVRKPVLVVDDAPVALARDLWLTTDESYKSAVTRLALKAAARRGMGGEPPPPDLVASEVVVDLDMSPVSPVDRDRLREIALTASARLTELGGTLRAGQVIAGETQGRLYQVGTAGTRIVQPRGHAAVYAYADVITEQGVRLFDRRQWVARTAADLPPTEEIADAVERMGHSLLWRADATAVDYYEGPVVFEGEAAADLFRYLLPSELRGTPPTPEAGRTYQQQVRGGARLGRRVLPRGWSVVDDPADVPEGLAGGHRYDMEGQSSRAVSLVEDGYVRGFVMSRVPRRDLAGSTGHAWGDVHGSELGARLSSWTVRPGRLVPSRRFDREVQALRRAADQPAVLVIRRMEQGWEGDLPLPTDAVWRFPDGAEVPVLSLELQGIDRRTLRGIVAASGGMQTFPYLAPKEVWGRAGTTSGLPMVVRAPVRVVIGDLEAAFPGTSEERPSYEMPPLGEAPPEQR